MIPVENRISSLKTATSKVSEIAKNTSHFGDGREHHIREIDTAAAG